MEIVDRFGISNGVMRREEGGGGEGRGGKEEEGRGILL